MSLKARFARSDIVLAPGVYDAFSALVAHQTGFEALYFSGAAHAYTRLARPDIGLASMSEVEQTLALICDTVDTPVIVDGDTGFGNALNMQRMVRTFERAGAAAIQIEDQTYPKRCGHLSDKSVVPAAEMVGKIRAAVDARHCEETLIIARTDAIAIEGFEAALERARSYAEAGADLLFVEAPGTIEQLASLGRSGLGAPLLANMVEGGRTPLLSASRLEEMGFSLVIFPAGVVRTIALAAQDYYQALKTEGSPLSMLDRMLDFNGLNGVIGTPGYLERGKGYAAEAATSAAGPGR